MKSYIDMNTIMKTEEKSVLGKTMENVRKHRDIKLITTTDKKWNRLVSEPAYHTTK